MEACRATDIASPERGRIYSRRGSRPSEWWRVSELLRSPEGDYVVLTRIDNRRETAVVAARHLDRGGEFEPVEARFQAAAAKPGAT